MRDQYMRTGQGFLMVIFLFMLYFFSFYIFYITQVYSITHRSSFDEISTFHEQILRVKDKDHVPVLLAANKCDLERDRFFFLFLFFSLFFPSILIICRQVTTAQGQELARSFNCPFFETSAKARINIDEVSFDSILYFYIVFYNFYIFSIFVR